MSDPSIGLALGGGGARGFAHGVVLEVMDELGLRPAAISGTSIGSVMGWAMASGLSGRAIREHALAAFGDNTQVMARLWSIRPQKVADWMSVLGNAQLSAEAILKAFLPDTLTADFADLTLPLHVVATDYHGAAPAVLSTGDVRQAVAASIAIPMVFRPVNRAGRVYVDGGVTMPLPTGALPPCDLVIAVDIIGGAHKQDPQRVPGASESVLGSVEILMQALTRAHLAAHPPSLTLTPPVSDFPVLGFLKTGEILAAADSARETMKRQIAQVVEAHLKPDGQSGPLTRQNRLP